MRASPILRSESPSPIGSASQHLAELPVLEPGTLVPDGSRAVFIAPPPHEAMGRASAAAPLAIGATLHELPLWGRRWATPDDLRLPWVRACKVALDNQTLARKKYAPHAFASQLGGDTRARLTATLKGALLDRLQQPFEVVSL